MDLTCYAALSDCTDFLTEQEDDSADMILADPPYYIGYDGGKGWDKQWKDEEEYLAWCANWTAQCVRILKPGRMLIVWGTLKTDAFLKYRLDTTRIHQGVLTRQNEIIWSYNWGGRSKDNFARKHEIAWAWSKGNSFLFNKGDVKVPRKMKKNIRGGMHEDGTIPTCVWEENNHTMSSDFCSWHPTSKNLTVLTRMIKAYTNPGDTVIDPFAGSGNTAIAAQRAGRGYKICEKDSEYFKAMQERVKTLTSDSKES